MTTTTHTAGRAGQRGYWAALILENVSGKVSWRKNIQLVLNKEILSAQTLEHFKGISYCSPQDLSINSELYLINCPTYEMLQVLTACLPIFFSLWSLSRLSCQLPGLGHYSPSPKASPPNPGRSFHGMDLIMLPPELEALQHLQCPLQEALAL